MTWTTLSASSGRYAFTSTSPSISFSYVFTPGDLVVVYGSWKNTSDIILPDGWTLVAKALQGTDDTTSSTIASGMMAYFIHDGRSGEATFTLETGVVGGLTRAAYRHTDGIVFDGGGVETAAASTNTFALSSGLTTSAPNCLLIAAGCSGRSTQITGYASTDPANAAGATDTVTEPTAGQWIRRNNVNSTAGSDCARGHADAIKATAGPTGPISATVGTAHRPVMIAAAFRPASAAPERQRSRLILTPW